MSTIKFNQWLNPDNTENYKCRAWVNFNGTGTVAIRASGNVSSITDNGVGDYTVNFTTAMPDVNYCAPITARGDGNVIRGAGGMIHYNAAAFVVGSLRFGTFAGSSENNPGLAWDSDAICVAIFR